MRRCVSSGLKESAVTEFETDDFDEPDARFDPFMRALGHVANGWSEYEHLINNFIWELANVEKIAGACITSQMIGPGPRFRCLLALLKFRNAPQGLIDGFNSHHTDAEKISRQRNRYMHDPILLDHETGQVKRMEITADKHVKQHFSDIEVKELSNFLKKIGALQGAFATLYERAQVELPPWPRTQYEQSEGIRPRRTTKGSGA
jgi:hypothetical protein